LTLPVGGGVLPVDKPAGPTSHDIVSRARRVLHERRIGHTGTLDPFASGLMLLCVGPATRLSPYLTGADKEYLARAELGTSTDTLDREGTVTATSEAWREVAEEDVSRGLDALRGELLQIPPRFSAKKVRGEAAHRRARRGEEVDLEPVPVTVHEIELVDFSPPSVEFRVVCSSGTYIRALARDLGESLGTGAHLTALRRTRVGDFSVEGAVAGSFDEEIPEDAWLTPLAALSGMPPIEVDPDTARRIAQGQRVPVEGLPTGWVAVHVDGRLLAVAEGIEGVLHPRTVFPDTVEVAS
jgi:tRNA pseudouridine55 synthase